MLATMKHQFTELLSGIGFVPKDISVKRLERVARGVGAGSDGVQLVTGSELNTNNNNYKGKYEIYLAINILRPSFFYPLYAPCAIQT